MALHPIRSSLWLSLLGSLVLMGCKTEPDPLEVPEERPLGPGLGNVTWSAEELFEVASFVDNDSGVPVGNAAIRVLKPFGTNVAYMHNGYMLTLFASDSGFAGGGLLVYDVSDPRDPELMHTEYQLFSDDREEELDDIPDATVYDGRTGGFREAHSIGFSRVDGRDLAMFHTALGVEIWDLTNTLAPEPLSSLDLPGVEGGDYGNVAWQLSWQGNYAYVASSNQGVFVVDTSDPAEPVLADRGGLDNPIPPGELGGFRVGPIFAVGNQLVLSSMDDSGGYAVLDISEPAHPALQSSLTRGLEKFYSICFSGDRIIGSVRGADAEMTVHDVRDPYQIAPVGNRPVIDHQLYCSTQDHFAFQGNEGDIAKVDLSDPGNFEVVGRGAIDRPDADHGQVTPFGNMVFVGNDHGTGSGFIPHQVEPDESPPEVVAVFPEDGAVHVGPRTRLGLAFSDGIDNTSLTAENLALTDSTGEPVAGRFAVQGHLVNFAPDQPLHRGETYDVSVTLGGLMDWAGNPVANEFNSSFTVSDLEGGEPGALSLELTGPASVEVGQPASFSAAIQGASAAELSWRFEDSTGWTAFGTDASASHTFGEAGHITVYVRASDGVQTVVDSVRVTVHETVVGQPASSSSVALDESGGWAWVANRDNGTVSRVDLDTLATLDEFSVGDTPAAVAVDGTGTAWLALQGDAVVRVSSTGTVQTTATAYGSSPCGLVVDVDAGRVYVSEAGSGDVAVFDASSGAELERTFVGDGVCGLGLSADASRLWVSGLRGSDSGARVHEVQSQPLRYLGEVVLPVDEQTVDAEDRSRGVPTFLGSPALSPSDAWAWVPAVQSNIRRGQYRDGEVLTHESTVRAVLSTIDLADGSEVGRLDFNDRAGPIAAVTSPLGDYVFVALLGSNEIAVLDTFTGASAAAIAGAGSAPRGLALSEDGMRLYVHGWLSRELLAYDVSGLLDGSSSVPVWLGSADLVTTEQLTAEALLGKRIFYRAKDPRMSLDGYISCASCHLDGSHDGLVWDFTERGEGLRNTTDLRGRSGLGHGPVHWTANFDEIQDFENDIRDGFGGTGFMSDVEFEVGTRSDPLGDPKAGLSAELDALSAYVSSLDRAPASPFRDADGSSPVEAQRGAQLFASLGCDGCHADASYTDSGSGLHDVGTITAASGQRRGETLTGLDTPSLLGVWDGGPWLHDGSAESLEAVLVERNSGDQHGAVSGLSEGELSDLVAYLQGLD